jgi:CheY-like chemotaxis protein
MASILVIEDDRNLRMILLQILEQAGYTVAEAADGAEALGRLATVQADLVITDILMPEKEGIETIVSLRRQRPGIKIMAMSGGGRVGASHCLEMAREFGADASISKPFNRKDMLAAVEGLIGPGHRPAAQFEVAAASVGESPSAEAPATRLVPTRRRSAKPR